MTKCFCGANVWCFEDTWDDDTAHLRYYCNQCGRCYSEDKYLIMATVQKIEDGTIVKVTFDWGS